MKNIETHSYKKQIVVSYTDEVQALCDGCGRTVTTDLPTAVRHDEGKEDIYCAKCKSQSIPYKKRNT